MKFLSVNDGDLAFVAIGGAPVGVIAIGITPIGLVSIGCGGAIGGVAVAAGIAVGGLVVGAGLGVGLWIYVAGLGLRVVPREPYPRAASPAVVDDADGVLRREVEAGWVHVALEWNRDGVPEISVAGRELSIANAPDLDATQVTGLETARARLSWTDEVAGNPTDYRSAPERQPRLVCHALEGLPEPPPRPDVFGWWFSFLWRLAVFVAVVGASSVVVVKQVRLASLDRKVSVDWHGRLKSGSGLRAAPGDACVLHVDFRGDGVSHSTARAEVSCLDQALDSIGTAGCDFNELPETREATSFVYRFRCKDATVDIDTHRRRIAVHKPSSSKPKRERIDAEIEIDEISQPNRGLPIFIGHTRRDPGFAETRWRGVVESVGSPALGLKAGGTCEVVVLPVHLEPRNCKVEVTCEGRVLYGAGRSGMNHCDLAGGKVIGVHDPKTTSEDEDPALELDARGASVRVRDDAFDVRVRLLP
jgi:hypothetical protein